MGICLDTEVGLIQPNEIDPNYGLPPPSIKPIIKFDSLKPEELPRTSDGIFFRVAHVTWPELPESIEELAASPEIKETMNYGQELAVTFNGENELTCFSQDAQMLTNDMIIKDLTNIFAMKSLNLGSSNSQKNQPISDRQSPRNQKKKNNIKERKDISEVGLIEPNEIDPNNSPPTPPIKPIVEVNSFGPEGLMPPEEPDDDKMNDGLVYRVQHFVDPIWPPTKSVEELLASPEVKCMQEAVKNGKELSIKINWPDESECDSEKFYTNDPKILKLFKKK